MYHISNLEPDRRRSYTGLLPPCKEFGALPEEVETETGNGQVEVEEFQTGCRELQTRSGPFHTGSGYKTGSDQFEDEEFQGTEALEAACEDLRKGSIELPGISLTLLVPQVQIYSPFLFYSVTFFCPFFRSGGWERVPGYRSVRSGL